jgi:hypothetical protein
MTTHIGRLLILSTLLFGSSSACDDDDDDDDDEGEEALVGSCAEISEACHEHDDGSGLSHTCHELAHENNTDDCDAMKEACITACDSAHQ